MGFHYGDTSFVDFAWGEVAFSASDDDALPVIVKTFKKIRGRNFFSILTQFSKAKKATHRQGDDKAHNSSQ